MNVGLALEIDATIDELAPVIAELEDALKEFFQEKDYGSDVANLTIGVILTFPDLERLHRVRDLEYRRRCWTGTDESIRTSMCRNSGTI